MIGASPLYQTRETRPCLTEIQPNSNLGETQILHKYSPSGLLKKKRGKLAFLTTTRCSASVNQQSQVVGKFLVICKEPAFCLEGANPASRGRCLRHWTSLTGCVPGPFHQGQRPARSLPSLRSRLPPHTRRLPQTSLSKTSSAELKIKACLYNIVSF